jgi:hypothetical protein
MTSHSGEKYRSSVEAVVLEVVLKLYSSKQTVSFSFGLRPGDSDGEIGECPAG